MKKSFEVALRNHFRAFLLQELQQRDRAASANMVRRWNARQNRLPRNYGMGRPHHGESYGPLDEDIFEDTLIGVYADFRDQPTKLLELFVRYGRMTDEEFDTEVEVLRNKSWHDRARTFDESVLGPIADVLEQLPGAKGESFLDRRLSGRTTIIILAVVIAAFVILFFSAWN